MDNLKIIYIQFLKLEMNYYKNIFKFGDAKLKYIFSFEIIEVY